MGGGRGRGRAGLADGVEGAGSVEELCGVNLGDVRGRKEGERNVGGRDAVGEFRDGEDVVRIESEKDSMDSAAERAGGGADEVEAVLWFADNAAPSGSGVADLEAKMRHGGTFPGGRECERIEGLCA